MDTGCGVEEMEGGEDCPVICVLCLISPFVCFSSFMLWCIDP